MNSLIIDATKDKIFLIIIRSKIVYSVSHENSKTNYESLTILIKNFLKINSLKIEDISKLYVNRGPGSFAGIRNSLAVVKGIYVAKKLIIIALVLTILTSQIEENTKKFQIFAKN